VVAIFAALVLLCVFSGASSAAGPAAALTPSAFDFGSVQVGSVSDVVDVTVANAGAAATSVSRFGIATSSVNPKDFWVAPGGTCVVGASLAPGDSCTVRVRFNPVETGALSAKLSVWVNNLNVRVDAALNGAGMAAPQATLAPDAVDFGSVQAGSVSTPVDVTVTNSGGGTLNFARFGIASSSANPSDFWVAPGGTCSTSVSLASGESCTVRVRFNPVETGALSGKLSFWVNTPAGRVDAQLSGSGLAAGQPSLTPDAVDFGTVALGSTSDPVDVTLSNTGAGALSFWRFGIADSSANASDFRVVPGGTCATSVALASGETCTVRVRFAPTAAGTRSAKLSFWVNSLAGRVDATLTGNVDDPCADGCF
jgi:archaellum component FlaF (FlaF/FlaG flagellin family)